MGEIPETARPTERTARGSLIRCGIRAFLIVAIPLLDLPESTFSSSIIEGKGSVLHQSVSLDRPGFEYRI